MKRNLHIMYVLSEFVTERDTGGIATYYDNISRILADDGNKITIFVLSDVNEKIDFYPGIVVNRVNLNTESIDASIPGSFIRYWSSGMRQVIQKYIESDKSVDIIQYASYKGLGVDRFDNIPTVVRISSFQPLMRAASAIDFNVNHVYKCKTAADYLELLTVVKADAVYSPSYLMADVFKKESGRNVSVIESPFFPNKNNFSPEIPKILKKKKYIFTVGTLSLLKGSKTIGDCVYEVLDRNKEVYWVFAGTDVPWVGKDGNYILSSEYIRRKAGTYSDRLIFLGKIQHTMVMEIIANSDICVMPSRIDNLANSGIEAMSLGKVVVGTEGSSYEQLIEDDKSGYLIPRDNYKELFYAINKGLDLTIEEKEEIGKRAKERTKKMSPEIIKEILLNFYYRTISNFNGKAEYEYDADYQRIISEYKKVSKTVG
ncbi:MAG: glycosyltransferase family 4 protein [Lachnospiraceae bacterium]|nr:glycosyltransferase family 4 protein [Lachnospiraceae bacterium]